MVLLLSADDNETCSEAGNNLQEALNILSAYCSKEHLLMQTKIIVHPKDKIRKLRVFKFNKEKAEVVFTLLYLGVKLSYSNKQHP